MKFIDRLERWYARNYKKLIVIPIIIFLISIGILINNKLKKGEFFEKNIDLSGGVIATVYIDSISPDIKEKFESLGLSVRELKKPETGEILAIIIEANKEFTKDDLEKLIKENLGDVKVDYRYVGPSMGASFLKSTIKAILIGIFLMGIVLVFLFKKPIVILTIATSAAFNMLEAAAFMTLFGIKLAPHTIGALLMLLGYSVDAEVLFDSKVLNVKKGDPVKNAFKALGTALTMSITTFVALLSLYYFSASPMIKELAFVLLLGLIFDIINTWFMNLSIVIWYKQEVEKV